LLVAHGFTVLAVVNDDTQPMGLVTGADLVRDRFRREPRRYVHDRVDGTLPTRVPSTTPAAMALSTDVADLIEELQRSHRRAMPIMDRSRLVGIVPRRDRVRAVARSDRDLTADMRHPPEICGDPVNRHVAPALTEEAVPGVMHTEPLSRREDAR
jgi:CBS-domain-containing membrane protein